MCESVQSHYGKGGLSERILAGLQEAGKDIERLGEDDLLPVDEFHSRGRRATEELYESSRFAPGMRVLDVGSGIGGPARFLARKGLHVTGLDITSEFCDVARDLTRRSGLEANIEFVQGDANSMPFSDGSFDGVWMQHANMNIEDKGLLFREVSRVLLPGAQFAFHEVLAGPAGEPHLPAPWASRCEFSFLMAADGLQSMLEQAGLEIVHWKDDTEATVAFFDRMFERLPNEGSPPLGAHLLFGPDSPRLFGNYAKSLRENRCQVVLAVAQKSG